MENSEIRREIKLQPEGITWPVGWTIHLEEDQKTYYGECPVCHSHFHDRVIARDHDVWHQQVTAGECCCSCWKHC